MPLLSETTKTNLFSAIGLPTRTAMLASPYTHFICYLTAIDREYSASEIISIETLLTNYIDLANQKQETIAASMVLQTDTTHLNFLLKYNLLEKEGNEYIATLCDFLDVPLYTLGAGNKPGSSLRNPIISY